MGLGLGLGLGLGFGLEAHEPPGPRRDVVACMAHPTRMQRRVTHLHADLVGARGLGLGVRG